MKRLLASLLLAVALVTMGATISLFIDAARGSDVSSSIGGGCVTLAFAALAGINAFRLFRTSADKRPRLSEDEKERLALACASSSGGKLTETELSLDSGLNLNEAKKTLGRLANRGTAEIEVSSSGAIVYAFPCLISEEEKKAAKPVEDA
jgi:hypothetical protein